jgi:hypothetical protein
MEAEESLGTVNGWRLAAVSKGCSTYIVIDENSFCADSFVLFLRITPETYSELLRLIEPLTSGNDTFIMRS